MQPIISYASCNSPSVYFYLNIDENTSVEVFDQLRKDSNSEKCYRYDLFAVALRGNTKLIRHLVHLNGKDNLNEGDDNGATPLLYCIYRAALNDCDRSNFITVSENASLVCPTLLCSLGANPNLANCQGWEDIPISATPLWIAAEKTTNLELVKMLRKYGAVVYLELSEKGKAMIDQADRENRIEQFNENKDVFLPMIYQQGQFGMFPIEIIKLIIHEKLNLDRQSLFLPQPPKLSSGTAK